MGVTLFDSGRHDEFICNDSFINYSLGGVLFEGQFFRFLILFLKSDVTIPHLLRLIYRFIVFEKIILRYIGVQFIHF